jgi:4-hydroxy-2-oxoheptanedioate aldolase
MRVNNVKMKWGKGEPAFGAWLAIPSSFSAEIMANQGYDYICIDMQHGMIDYQTAVTMLQAISTTDATPFVRVPWNEPGIIMKMLDAGAMGVVIPMVNTVEEAKAAVGACRYAPDGYRSFGPVRASIYAGSDYFKHSNDEVACIPMIETTTALENLDDILEVPGINAVYVGPADLSITLGQSPAMDNDGAFEEARLSIAAACARHNVVAGIHANAGLAQKHQDAGFQMVTISSDQGAMASSARQDIKVVYGSTREGGNPSYR